MISFVHRFFPQLRDRDGQIRVGSAPPASCFFLECESDGDVREEHDEADKVALWCAQRFGQINHLSDSAKRPWTVTKLDDGVYFRFTDPAMATLFRERWPVQEFEAR